MKNAKVTLRVILCLVLTLVVMLSMASCDVGGALESLADGDFKGAWGTLTGKHDYTAVVTKPTCLARGYTTYTCSHCGDVYVDDYVDPAHVLASHEGKAATCSEEGYEPYESCTRCSYTTYKSIPTTDHTYVEKVTRFPTPYTNGVKSKLCTVCGEHVDSYIDAVTFTLPEAQEILKAFVGQNVIEIGAKDTDIIIIKEYSGEDTTYNKNALGIKVAYVKIDGVSEEFYAHVSLELGLLSYDSIDEDAVPTFNEELVLDLLVKGNQVAFAVNTSGDVSEGDADLTEIFYSALASYFGMSYEEYVDSVYVGEKITACVPFVQAIVDSVLTFGSDEINPLLPAVISFIGDNIVTVEGNKYTVDIAGLAKALESLEGKTVSEIIDTRFGSGTFARVESFLISLPTMKVRDIADIAVKISEKSDVALDDIYSLINYVIYSATDADFNIESEIIIHYDMTILEIIGKANGVTDSKIAETAATIEEELQNFFDTARNLDVDQLYNLLVFGNTNHGPGTGEIFRITESLASVAEVLGGAIKLEVVVNDDGGVESFDVSFDGAVYVSAVKDGENFDLTLESTGIFNDESVTYLLTVSGNADGFTVNYTIGEESLITVNAQKGEDGSIVALDASYSQVVTIWGATLDPENPNEIMEESYQEIEWVADYTYRNDGENISLVIEYENGSATLTATVTDLGDGKQVVGSFIDKSALDDYVTGEFTLVTNADGYIEQLTLNVNEVRCDYEDVFNEEDESYTRVYDYDNPKTLHICAITYTNVDGNITLSVDANFVANNDGTFEIEDYFNVDATVTDTENNETVLDVVVDSAEKYEFKLTVSYGEDAEIINGIKLEYFLNDEIDILIEATASETEGGRYFSFYVEGLKYIHYDTEYEFIDPTPDKPGYGGDIYYDEDYIDPADYDGSEVTIVFYHTMGSAQRAVLDEYIAKFNEQYPNITIEHQQVGGYDEVRDLVSTQITVGAQPNIAYCYGDHVALYNTAGVVVPLDGFIESNSLGFSEYELEDFIDGFYAEGSTFDDRGTMYTLPLSKSTEILYYNKTFFEAYGLNVPTTWDEVEEVCRQIKEINPYSIPLGYDSEANWFITMCEQYGSPYTSLDDHYLFDNEVNRAFVERFREWYQNGWVTTSQIHGSYMSNLLVAQQCYMVIGSSAGASYYSNGYFEVGMAAVPQVNINNPKVISQGPSLCIFKQADYQEVVASWLFVKFLTTDVEFQAEFSMVTGYMPVIESVLDHPVYELFLESDDIRARSIKMSLLERVAFFASPAFYGSAYARQQVGNLMIDCFTMYSENVADDISYMFECAIYECRWYEY